MAESTWMTLEEAHAAGVWLTGVLPDIGPRRVGTVYYGGYWGTVSTVVGVCVKVINHNGEKLAVSWLITEYHSDDSRDRHHSTSWRYDARNRVLHGPADIRPRSERRQWGRYSPAY